MEEKGDGRTKKKKLYAYVDESGQDTKGVLFVVSVLVVEEHRETLLAELEAIETRTGKKNVKWHKARNLFRQAYIEEISHLPHLRYSVFFERFEDSKEYLELTAFATAKAIFKRAHGDYKVTVLVDGLNRREVTTFTKSLRDLRVQTRKVRGVRKDENDVFIRLVDAICGLVRDAHEKGSWATGALTQLEKNKCITEL